MTPTEFLQQSRAKYAANQTAAAQSEGEFINERAEPQRAAARQAMLKVLGITADQLPDEAITLDASNEGEDERPSVLYAGLSFLTGYFQSGTLHFLELSHKCAACGEIADSYGDRVPIRNLDDVGSFLAVEDKGAFKCAACRLIENICVDTLEQQREKVRAQVEENLQTGDTLTPTVLFLAEVAFGIWEQQRRQNDVLEGLGEQLEGMENSFNEALGPEVQSTQSDEHWKARDESFGERLRTLGDTSADFDDPFKDE